MTIRKLLLILFLYILLVWIIATYLHSGDLNALTNLGLLWTAVGVAALLVGVLLERVFGWWRAHQKQKTAKPAQGAAGPKVLHEDDAALLSLIQEADQRLVQAPGAAGTGATGVLGLPLFLALGPERSGKTSAIHNSGIEPSLLAGQVLGSTGSVASTKIANLWLAHESLLLEVGGRVFNSERLGEFLSLLQAGNMSGWKSWIGPQHPILLRGVLVFFDAREFMGTPEPSKLDRATQTIRARLLSAAGVFGTEFPVYCLFTNTDALPYFEDFFNGMPGSEAGQVLGVLRNSSERQPQGQVWPQTETKRLNQLFQSLFLRLSERRLIALSQETDPARRPSIYEFPREFRRIRAPLVQFLVDVFKPDPLKAGPQLRGVFFTGTRKVEDVRPAAAETTVFRPRGGAPDATQFFALDAAGTTIFRPKSRLGVGRLTDQWVFASEFFQKVLRLDRPFVRPIATHSKFDRYRGIATAVGAALGVLLALIWTVSWVGNWGLVSRTESTVKDVQGGNSELSMANLLALDRLRMQLDQLQQDSPWHLHWGLYTGGDLRDTAARAYFARLRQLSLEQIDLTLARQLRLAGSPEQKEDSGGIYDRLKTVQTIAPRTCEVNQPLLNKVLLGTIPEAHKGLGDSERALLGTQLSFYVTQLAANRNLPLKLTEDSIAVQNAQAYVRGQNGPEQRLGGLLSEIGGRAKSLTVPAEYNLVLKGQTTFPGVFTKAGQSIFEDRVAHDNFGSEERCVMGDSAGQQIVQHLDTGQRDRLRDAYYRKYADAWIDFLKSYSVIHFGGLDDAVQKLSKLSDSRSPLLGIVQMAAVNTDFEAKPGELTGWEKAAQKVGLGGLVQTESDGGKKAGKVAQILTNNDAPLITPAGVATLFQPVLITIPPPADLLVNGNNKDYVDGLRKLEDNLDTYSRASTAEKLSLVAGANAAVNQARAARAALSDNFRDVGNKGLNKVLADLLEQPIDLAGNWIPVNREKEISGAKDKDLKRFCTEMTPILGKYPLNGRPDSKPEFDAPFSDIEKAFAPNKGLVWVYQKSVSDLVVPSKDQVWEANPALQDVKVSQELLNFLNRSQDIKKAFFTESGGPRPLQYTLRPVKNQKIIGDHLTLDGQDLAADAVFQQPFSWTASGAVHGAEGNVMFLPAGHTGFGKFDDLWAVFRLFGNADDRPLNKREVQWSKNRGLGGAAAQTIDPPGRIDILDFPNGVDLFNPKFFEDLKCPGRAVVAN